MIRLQGALPERYTKASPEQLAEWIGTAKSSLGDRVFILGHHYQRDEVMAWADARGDSFGLSRIAAAQHEADPAYAKGFRTGLDPEGVPGMGATLAMGYTTLEADYVWMYEDGWGGNTSLTPNLACTFAGALGCWGHRDQLLGYDGTYNFGVGLHCTTCEMGTGFAVVNGTGSFTSRIELPAGSPPPMYFTWAKNVVPFLAPSQTTIG